MAKEVTEEKPKRSAKGKKSKEPQVSRLAWLRDERLHRVVGLFIMLLSAIMLVAFTSFVINELTGGSDHAQVVNFDTDVATDKSQRASNWAGWLGARIAYLFFYKGFGIASFLILPLFFLAGAKLFNKSWNLAWAKWALHLLPPLFWISVLLGFLTDLPLWSGAFGIYVSDWGFQFIGYFGMLASLIFVFMAYLMLLFNVDFSKKKMFGATATAQASGNNLEVNYEDESEVRDWEKSIQHENKEAIDNYLKENEEAPLEEWVEAPAENESEEDLFEEINREPSKKKEALSDDLELDIVETSEPTEEEELVGSGDISEEAAAVLAAEPYDPTLDLPGYEFPPLSFLNEYGSDTIRIDKEELERNKNQIVETLRNYNIEIAKIKATIGPTVTLYEIVPAPGVRIAKIKNLEDDIALALAALGIRIIAPIPGKGTIGIEVPNAHKEVVSMKSLLASDKFQNAKMDLPVALGKNIANEIFIADLAKMPHLLMAGATGQGKSVGINSILVSLLYKRHPAELKFVMVDPKKVELSLFKEIEKHYLAKLPGDDDPIITDTKKVVYTINALCVEMDNRYDLLKEAGARNLKEYNAKFISRRLNPSKGHQFLPYIVLVIDEFADLMMTAGKEVETPIARLAQLARAVGIHLVIATQRPSVNIITGVIKANFPARIAFKVTSNVDSRTILDQGGANQLIGRGDMLFSNGGEITRLQCGFVDTPEVEQIVQFIGKQRGYPDAFILPEYEDEKGENLLGGNLSPDERDPMFEEAARIIVGSQMGSTSMLQRKLKLGYNRAGRLMDQLEQAGVVGPNLGSKAREVIYKDISELEQYLRNL